MSLFQKYIGKAFAMALAGAWLASSVSCVNPKEVIYIRDAETGTTQALTLNYQPTIQKDDQLSVSVSSRQPELIAPFSMNEMSATGSGSSSTGSRGYLVDVKGDVVLPIIGRIPAAGKSCSQLANDIAAALRNNGYINDASVNVQIMNFKFSVLGEVGSPGTHSVEGQRITILEAIAKAGDLSIDADRTVQIVREKDGQRQIAHVDLRSKDLFSSPFYYIQQNDVIYVLPNQRVINTRSEEMQLLGWSLSGLGLVAAVVALCI